MFIIVVVNKICLVDILRKKLNLERRYINPIDYWLLEFFLFWNSTYYSII